jgi:hypothetical protein
MVVASVNILAKEFAVEGASWEERKKAWIAKGLRVVDPRDGAYAIVKADREKKVEGLSSKWIRSIVVEKATGKVMCVAPPKATELPRTEEGWSSLKKVMSQHFTDGVMMNLFWPIDSSKPQVVTRSRLGADNTFYSELSFVDMLQEALAHYSRASGKGFHGDLNDLKPAGKDDEVQFISIVLQHPKNRVVTEVSTPRVTVIHTGSVSKEGDVSIYETPDIWPEHIKGLAPGSLSLDPSHLENFETFQKFVEDQAKDLGYQWQGVVLKDGSGNRYRLRNKAYASVRTLRGNESDGVERFCRVRKDRCIKKYLEYYPEDEKIFYELEGKLRNATRKMLDLYVDTFKFKKQEFHTLPWPFKHHVSVLHNKFKEELRPNRKTVDLEFVIQYVTALSVEDMANLYKEPAPPRKQTTAPPTKPTATPTKTSYASVTAPK